MAKSWPLLRMPTSGCLWQGVNVQKSTFAAYQKVRSQDKHTTSMKLANSLILSQKIMPSSPVIGREHHLTGQQKENQLSDTSPMLPTLLPVLLIKQSAHGKSRSPSNTTSSVKYSAMKKLNGSQTVDLGTMRSNLHQTHLKPQIAKCIHLPKDNRNYWTNSWTSTSKRDISVFPTHHTLHPSSLSRRMVKRMVSWKHGYIPF